MKEYDYDQGLLILQNTIQYKTEHQDYKRTCELADLYTKYTTGENIDDLLIQFTPREDKLLFDQRVRLTKAITPDIVNTICNPMYKVGRTTAKIDITWKDAQKTEANKKTLLEYLDNYYGEDSLITYLSSRLVELDGTDPNTFIVTEFSGEFNPDDATAEKPKPYPFEVSASEAVNFEYINNTLTFLIVRNKIKYADVANKLQDGFKFTIYLTNNSITATQICVETADKFITPEYLILYPGSFIFYTYKDSMMKDKDAAFVMTPYEQNSKVVPARRIGTKRDLMTRGRTCVSMIHPAMPYLFKCMKSVSEFDITNAQHIFPQKYQYSDACEGQFVKGNSLGCHGGTNNEGKQCQACEGTGQKVHKAAHDVIYKRMPKDPKDFVGLDKLTHYDHPPIDLLKFMEEISFDRWKRMSLSAVYNGDTYISQSHEKAIIVSKTAKEANIDLESVYDTLKSYADNFSMVWRHIVKIIAAYVDLADDLSVTHEFPRDFKMKPLSMLLADLQAANTGDLPPQIKKAITKDIAHSLYVDNPRELLKIETKEKFYPFNGKAQLEIQFILANDLAMECDRVLYANFETIFSELELEALNSKTPIDFYKLSYDLQMTLVTAKVNEYITAIASGTFIDRAKALAPETPTDPNLLFDIEDQVTIKPGMEQDPTHAGITFTVKEADSSTEGGIYSLHSPDYSSLISYCGNNLLMVN